MQDKLLYIELKTGYQDNGPAWIARVEHSKTGKAIYFNGNILKKRRRGGGAGIFPTHYDPITGEEYWVSGVKKNGQDRHWAGGGTVMIDRKIVNEYMEMTGLKTLSKTKYQVVDIQPTNKQQFAELENQK